MSGSLAGKRVLITGAAAGIGLGIARACAREGASLIVADINYDSLVDNTHALAGPDSDVHAMILDVSRRQHVRDFFAELEARFERIDGVVNNAGVTIQSDFLSFPEADLERLWATNLRSVFYVSQQAARYMKERGGGSILNIASSHTVASTPGYEMYAATKGGIAAMTKAMCWSLGAHGIRVNTLSPGLTRTEEVSEVARTRPDLAQAFDAMHASGRYATVDEIGEIAAFLLSDKAAAISGAEIVADHGQSALLVPAKDLV